MTPEEKSVWFEVVVTHIRGGGTAGVATATAWEVIKSFRAEDEAKEEWK